MTDTRLICSNRKLEYMKEYYEKNKESRKKYQCDRNSQRRKEDLAQYLLDRKEESKEYYMRNKEKVRERHKRYYDGRGKHYHMEYNYGLSKERYDSCLREQGGVCAICGKDNPPTARIKRLCVDHSHETGAFRGLLCASCNRGLGLLGDSPEILIRAVQYLNRRRDG